MIEVNASGVEELRAHITVVGVGGAGGNAIANMITSGVQGVDFVVANTDAQALNASPAIRKLQLGRNTTQGLGAGSRPEVGWAAAEESISEIETMLEGAHMCFVAAGMGGGTGTGAAPVIARTARARGIQTVGVVTKPFAFEGKRRVLAAEAGIEELQRHVDTLIVIPNQNLFRIANPGTTFKAAFDLADEVLQRGVRGITDLMVMPGLINLDFADVRSIMANTGRAMMGTGEASGDDRAIEAAQIAISNPLLDDALKGARGLIVSITGGEDMRLMEVDEAATYIKDMVDPEADIIWGSAFDPALEGQMRVSVIATGIHKGVEGAASESVLAAESVPAPSRVPALETMVSPPRPFFFAPAATPVAAEPKEPVAPAASPMEPLRVLEVVRAEEMSTMAEFKPAPEPLVLTADNVIAIHASRREPTRADVDQDRQLDVRGPSLFERVAAVARGSVKGDVDTELTELARIHRGRFAARAMA